MSARKHQRSMPDLEEDEETDERAPLVAARPEPAPPAWREIRAMLWLLRWVLLLALLNTCLMRTGSVAYFPYLRTLQHCDTPANPAATHTSDWSGSDHCGDLKLVTREAQAIVGLGRGVGLVAHCVSMPFLGRLGDTVGRRVLLIIHFVGMLLESMINAANPSVPVFVLGCALRGALSSLWPALMSMIADLCRCATRSSYSSAGPYLNHNTNPNPNPNPDPSLGPSSASSPTASSRSPPRSSAPSASSP